MKRALGFPLFLLFMSVAAATAAQSAHSEPGYTIAFGSAAPYNTDIFIADADGTHARPLAPNPALDYNASFSPDGQWVLFTSHRSGPAEIYRVHPDGSGIEKLTSDRAFDDQAALSPDGKSLAYVSTKSGQADIWVVDLRTRKSRNVTHHPAGDFRPAWSHDGKWIAFTSDRDPPNQSCAVYGVPAFVRLQYTGIYVIRPDGSELRRLTDTTHAAGTPRWSQDDSHLVVYQTSAGDVCMKPAFLVGSGTTQIVSVSFKNGEQETLTTGPGEKVYPHWVADHQVAYAFIGEHPGIAFPAGNGRTDGIFDAPDWSPDLHSMLFHREIDDRAAISDANPGVQEWYSPDPRFKLLRTRTAAVGCSGSRSNDRIVCETPTPSLTSKGLAVSKYDGSGTKVIFEDLHRAATGTAWSPGGDWIAFGLGAFFDDADSMPARLMLIRPDGSGLKALTGVDGNYAMPSWSPDGKSLVSRFAKGETRGLAILNVATGDSRILQTGSNRDTFPSWSPRGDWISFTGRRGGDYEIYVIHPDGTGLKRLTRSPGNDAHASFSPDGEWIAFATARGGFKDEAILQQGNFQPYGEIGVMRANGSDFHLLTDDAIEEGVPTWVGR
jgi:TolB protein